MGIYGDTGVKAEALHTRTALSRDEFDNLGIDAIAESHDRFARTVTRCDSVLQ